MYILDKTLDYKIALTIAGGKAANLLQIENAGLQVPPWFCLTSKCFSEFIHQFDENVLLHSSHHELESLFLKSKMDEKLMSEIKYHWNQLLLNSSCAVRSSGIGEDSADSSFAGQFSSYLNQKSFEDIVESIKRCWASSFNTRATAYRQQKGLDKDIFQMAVLIQSMVDAEISGVAFSRDPVNVLGRNQIVISSVFGLGEGLVSGELEADLYEVSRVDNNLKSTLAKKEFQFVVDDCSGIIKKSIDSSEVETSSLQRHQIDLIKDACMRLEKQFSLPQDIEWCFKNNKLYILQSRPITNLPVESFYDRSIMGSHSILWDNSNITESYSGITSPLTFSHISKAYRQVYLQYCEVMGVPAPIIKQHEKTFRNMLGHIRGRVYYNLGNWYQMVYLFPFADSSKEFMETMMGVKQGLKPELAALFDFTNKKAPYSFTRKIFIAMNNIIKLLFVKQAIKKFKNDFDRVYTDALKTDYSQKSIDQLLQSYDYLIQELLFKWKAPIISDTRCMIFFGNIKKLSHKWFSQEHKDIYNNLLMGGSDLASTEPTILLMKMALKIKKDEKSNHYFVTTSTAEIIQDLRVKKDLMINDEYNYYIHKYGFRCVNELKLESIDLFEDSSFAIEAIKNYLQSKKDLEKIIEDKESGNAQSLDFVRKNLNFYRRTIYLYLLEKAKSAVKDREDLRLLRTNIFGICRRIFKEIGRKYYNLKIIDDPLDIFYLTIDEMFAYQEGRSLEVSFQQLVYQRKLDFELYEKSISPPDRFFTEGAVGLNAKYVQVLSQRDLLVSSDDNFEPGVLKGTPCCPGIVEAVVRVVRDIKDANDIKGEILVTERTDPGWVPVFPACSGLLIERGSLLSHSAVVARELGIPTIVGINNGLMKKLKTGMRVRMDATKGEIRILDENDK